MTAMTHHPATRWIDAAAQVLIGATAVVAACIALTGTGLRARGEAPASRLHVAMQAYEAQQWPQAYAQLAAAADAGDPAAARVAAMMARQGPLLFGQRFDVSPERLRRWDAAMHRGAAAVTSPGTDARTGGSPPAVRVAGAR
ncbi:MAG: hypothetical protein ACTHL8_01950 [Burkholderiaceae bacterium]